MPYIDVENSLLALRNLMEDGWTQKTMARNAIGKPVMPDSPYAVSWDLIGGMYKACFESQANFSAMEDALIAVLPASFKEQLDLPHYNDSPERTQSDIVELVNAAIAHHQRERNTE